MRSMELSIEVTAQPAEVPCALGISGRGLVVAGDDWCGKRP